MFFLFVSGGQSQSTISLCSGWIELSLCTMIFWMEPKTVLKTKLELYEFINTLLVIKQ